jgi:hypothetical protein
MFRDGGNNFRSAITMMGSASSNARWGRCCRLALRMAAEARSLDSSCRQRAAIRASLFVALQREAKTFQFGTPWNPIANQRFREKA